MTDATTPQSGPNSDDRTWGMFAWLGALLVNLIACGVGFVAPLIIMVTRGKDSPFVRANAVEALNVFITVSLVMVGATVLSFVIFLAIIVTPLALIGVILIEALALGAPIYGLVISIIGAIQANKGIEYRAPLALRFVK